MNISLFTYLIRTTLEHRTAELRPLEHRTLEH